jgi:glycosyltransferase involved in cell wall biosynthesis
MHVLIAIPVPCPGPSAAANRMQKIARGLRASGVIVRILSGHRGPSASGWSTDQFGTPVRLASLLRPATGEDEDFVTLARALFEEAPVDAVILYGQSWVRLRKIAAAANARSISLVADCTEWHTLRWRSQSAKGLIDQNLFRMLLLPRMSGVVAISQVWEEHAQRLGMPHVVIPALGEDPSEAPPNEPPSAEPLVVYVGSFACRELTEAILAGFEIAKRRGTPGKLRLIGRPVDAAVSRRLDAMLDRSAALRSAVERTGWVDDQQLAQSLREARAFVLLRADSWETRACFPTRLPAYLMTGRPVIISAVGDVERYLAHQRSAWLLPPGRAVTALGDAFTTLLQNRAEAERIGARGRTEGAEHFSYLRNGIRLATFLRSAVAGRSR